MSPEGAMISMILDKPHQRAIAREFFTSHGLIPFTAGTLASLLVSALRYRRRAALPETLTDQLAGLDADVVRLFVIADPDVAILMFMRSVRADIEAYCEGCYCASADAGSSSGENLWRTRRAAQKIHPVLIEIDDTSRCCAVILRAGQYEAFDLAAIILGEHGAPECFLEDLVAHAGELVAPALRVFMRRALMGSSIARDLASPPLRVHSKRAPSLNRKRSRGEIECADSPV
ncbi:MAG: hypothetical protein M0R66_08530 [Candidatus Omnitrophica bacterium]|jgi:hypothetical protein|nr:hypothetical protein [Candidatus Omnitrophota bacterium]